MINIGKLPGQLKKMVSEASRIIDKGFTIKPTSVLALSRGKKLSCSFPGRYEKHNKIPIYVSTNADVIGADGNLTRAGEFSVAEQVAAHLAYAAGYRGIGDLLIEVNDGALESLGPDVIRALKRVAGEVSDQVSQLTATLVIHGIAANWDYDPSRDLYEDQFHKLLPALAETFSHEETERIRLFLGIDPLLYPGITRAFMFDGVLALAKIYLFLPQYSREELLERIDPLWADQLKAFIEKMGLDEDCEYFLGHDFERRHSLVAHERLQEAMLDYFVGEEGYFSWQRAVSGEVDVARIMEAGHALQSYRFFDSYSMLCKVRGQDVTEELKKAEQKLIRTVASEHPDYKDDMVCKQVAIILAQMDMLPAAIKFQESRLGIDADLGYLGQ